LYLTPYLFKCLRFAKQLPPRAAKLPSTVLAVSRGPTESVEEVTTRGRARHPGATNWSGMDGQHANTDIEQGFLPEETASRTTDLSSSRWRDVQVHPAPTETGASAATVSRGLHVTFSEADSANSDHATLREAPKLIRMMEGRMSEFGDHASVAGEEEDISRQQLQMIKARTMFQMTGEIAEDGGGARKQLLFLTNSQAELLASSSASLQKLLDALEIPKPKLVHVARFRGLLHLGHSCEHGELEHRRCRPCARPRRIPDAGRRGTSP
jgi:hypothetical protein